jgi:hypothetical protein
MPSESLMRDRIDLLKKDGGRFENLNASVQGNRVYMNAGKLHVEPGDLIVRHMSIGADETYEVTDPEFFEGLGGFPPNYQMHVRRLDRLEATQAVQGVTYNINGANARVNQGSTDNSINMAVPDSQALDLLRQLQSEVEALSLDDDERASALDLLSAVQNQLADGRPSRTVLSALLGALPAVASVTAIAASLVAIFK